jgi:hypothetical protein
MRGAIFRWEFFPCQAILIAIESRMRIAVTSFTLISSNFDNLEADKNSLVAEQINRCLATCLRHKTNSVRVQSL